MKNKNPCRRQKPKKKSNLNFCSIVIIQSNCRNEIDSIKINKFIKLLNAGCLIEMNFIYKTKTVDGNVTEMG